MKTYAFTLVDRSVTIQNCWIGFHTKREAVAVAKRKVNGFLPHAEIYLCPGNGEDVEDVAYVDLVNGKIRVTDW